MEQYPNIPRAHQHSDSLHPHNYVIVERFECLLQVVPVIVFLHSFLWLSCEYCYVVLLCGFFSLPYSNFDYDYFVRL
jgi:hypothetical protein